jgi:hypothetical protein
MKDRARAFVEDQLPPHIRAELSPALNSAYASVEALKSDTPILNIPSAQLGHLRAWATDWAVKRLIDAGKWPFDYDWQPYKNDTGQWLRVRLTHSLLSVSQVADPIYPPRDAEFRNNGALNNEPFFALPEFVEEERVNGLPHLLLLHGYQELTHIHIGVPRPRSRGFIYRTPNIISEPYAANDDRPKEEATDAEAIVELKEEIRKWMRDA